MSYCTDRHFTLYITHKSNSSLTLCGMSKLFTFYPTDWLYSLILKGYKQVRKNVYITSISVKYFLTSWKIQLLFWSHIVLVNTILINFVMITKHIFLSTILCISNIPAMLFIQVPTVYSCDRPCIHIFGYIMTYCLSLTLFIFFTLQPQFTQYQW